MSVPLANARQERFVQALARGVPATKAYVEAGYRPSEQHASRLAGNGKVRARLAELMTETAELAKIDAAWILRSAIKLYEKALTAGAYSAAKGALELAGKHVDVQAFKERIEHGGRVELAHLSDAELDAELARLSGARAPATSVH